METVLDIQKERIHDEIGAVLEKLDRNMERFGNAFPHMSRTGIYSGSLNGDGSWTGSFWTGMILLAYSYTGDAKYLEYAKAYLPVYQHRLQYGHKDHDLGFLYQLYAANLFRATGDAAAKELVVQAGEELLRRYNPQGRFIRAWGDHGSDFRRGVMIIDCMMNLPLLHTAASLTGEKRFSAAADSHAGSTFIYNIRPDASTYHTYVFNPDTGAPIGGFNEGGYSDESAWSRGQAWGIYGFALAGRHYGRREYAGAAGRLADYFAAQLPADGVPYWDFKLPEGAPALRDASAAAIAASGMWELANLLEETTAADAGHSEPAASPERAFRYRSYATRLAAALMDSCSASRDTSVEGLLRNCYAREPDMTQGHFYTIWGDYYYLELLLKLAGHEPRMWTCE